MNKFAFVAVASALALVACGKKEEAPAPAPVVETPADGAGGVQPPLVDNPDLTKPLPLLQEVPAAEAEKK